MKFKYNVNASNFSFKSAIKRATFGKSRLAETSVKINWELENLVEKNDLSIMILGIFVYAPTDCALQQKNAIKAYLMENYCKEVQIE